MCKHDETVNGGLICHFMLMRNMFIHEDKTFLKIQQNMQGHSTVGQKLFRSTTVLFKLIAFAPTL